jgi:hypothetical protein
LEELYKELTLDASRILSRDLSRRLRLETWKTTTATALKTSRIIFTTAVPGLYFWDGFV